MTPDYRNPPTREKLEASTEDLFDLVRRVWFDGYDAGFDRGFYHGKNFGETEWTEPRHKEVDDGIR